MIVSWLKQPRFYGYVLFWVLLSVVLVLGVLYFKPLYVFGGIFVVVLVGVIIKHPVWGIYLLAFSLPFERLGSVDISNVTVRPSQILAIITLAVWIARGFVFNKFKLRANPLFIPILLFISINVVGLLNTPNLNRSLLVLGFTIFTIALVLIIPNIIRHPQQIYYCVWALLISCGIVSIFGLYQFTGDLIGLPTTLTGLRAQYTKSILGFPRVQSTALEPLYFANYLLIPLGLALSLLLSKVKNIPVWLLVVISALGSVNLVLTVSRGGYIAFIALVVLLAGIYFKALLRPRTVISILVAVTVVGFVSLRFINVTKQWDTFVGHVGNIFGGASYSERIETFAIAERIWLAHPWVGIGAGGFGPYASYHPLIQPAEGYKIVNNEYVELLAETGVFGLGIFMMMMFIVVIRSWKALLRGHNTILRAILIGLVTALLAILVQYNTFSILYIMHIWFTIGLIIAVQNCLLYENVPAKNIQ